MSASAPLIDAYLSAIGRPTGEVSCDSIQQQLSAKIGEAHGAWPAVSIDDETFVLHLARHTPPNGPLEQGLEQLPSADLYLACACGHGVSAALEAFEQAFAADLADVHTRTRGCRAPLEELVQAVRTKLFVGEAPRILEYAGTGSLRHWVRVVAARTFVDLARRLSPDADVLESDGPLAVPAPDDDPELAFLKRTYRAEIASAFEEAARSLSAEQRNILREYYAHSLTIDQISELRGIHRATAARRVATARDALLRSTRQLLMARLELDRAELDSMARLVASQVHVTVDRVLGETAESAGDR